jgi:4-hydroxybenzoate polyprenyltransferase
MIPGEQSGMRREAGSMRHKFLVRCADALFLSRPLLLIPVWGYCAFGYVAGSRWIARSPFAVCWNAPLSIFGWMIVFSLSVAAIYVLNQIADCDVDAANAGFPILAKGKIPIRLAWGTFVVLGLSSVLIPLVFRPILAIYSCLALAVGFVYSAKPIQLSGRPIGDFVANATGFGIIAFGAGWHLSGATLGARFLVASMPYFFLMCAGSISSTLPDYEGDRKFGKNTTAVWIGVRPAHVIACVFIAAGLVSALLARDWAAAVCAGVAVPFYVAFLIRNSVRTMESTYKVGGVILMLAAAFLFPLLVPVSLLCLAGTVGYFRMRFHVWYPSLVPASPER